MHRLKLIILVMLTVGAGVLWSPFSRAGTKTSDEYLKQLDTLSALWSYYKHTSIHDGRVVSLDEGGVTTSEGQSYALLRAVWSDDPMTFKEVWTWTKTNLQIRGTDKLLAWKWKGRVLDKNSATDADTDTALALILASRRFDEPHYLDEARALLNSIWNFEILKAKNHYVVTAGNWAPFEVNPTIHVAYLEPYAYEIFKGVDSVHPWKTLIDSSYEILHWIYFEKKLKLPPEIIYIDKNSTRLFLKNPATGAEPRFGYDDVPLFFRVALDKEWFGRPQKKLRQRMLSFFKSEWARDKKFMDTYSVDGTRQSNLEGLPLYATVSSLALTEDESFAREIWTGRLRGLYEAAAQGRPAPYYLENWLWFGQALKLNVLRTYDEFLGFLRPFDYKGFSAFFPWVLFFLASILYFLAPFHGAFKFSFVAIGFYLCGRYIWWRLFYSLNFREAVGPVISIALWGAEFYCFLTVALLILQVGLGKKKDKDREKGLTLPLERQGDPAGSLGGFQPGVDIFIPIYSESCEILEKTLIGAAAIAYDNKKIYVCDDSHRAEVARLAESYGATYIQGPKKHAKAGNLNNALRLTHGELIVVFDTDHIPVRTFLSETVPFFADAQMGFVQTPHHFYNEDIFQRAFLTADRVPNEQDMFNHAIQGGRHSWGGSFFVGSGAVFRRKAIDSVGGFNLMSITEDIHTSQHLHAKGWKSAFVDKDLAVGLTAENFASYLVQRRRWMLGCLQIFFKDNPLFCRGLQFRFRLGYFASLFYFLFPIPRVIFWATPMYFLLFHWHPVFAEVSVLVAYLLPYMVFLPLLSSVALSGWPRLMWGSVYENAVSLPLFRSMADIFLPKNLGFKVTPKGIVSAKRQFDAGSVKITLAMAALNLFAILKGFWEFYYFGIEKDAYFFNLAWAIFNFLFLGMGLLVAWERPQRRVQDRISKKIPFRLTAPGFDYKGVTHDVSLSGLAFLPEKSVAFPSQVTVHLDTVPAMTLNGEMVYNDRRGRRPRCALKFVNSTVDDFRGLVQNIFGDPETWVGVHDRRARGNLMMALQFYKGLVRCFFPSRASLRQRPRQKTWASLKLKRGDVQMTGILRDTTADGAGILSFGKRAPEGDLWFLSGQGLSVEAERIYTRRLLPLVWRSGFRIKKDMAK